MGGFDIVNPLEIRYSGTSLPFIQLYRTNADIANTPPYIQMGKDANDYYIFGGAFSVGGTLIHCAILTSSSGGASAAGHGDIVFYPDSVEKMRLTASGYLSLAIGASINDIDITMAGAPTDNQLLTAQAIKEYVAAPTGTIDIDALILTAGATVTDIDIVMPAAPTDAQLLTAQAIKEYVDSPTCRVTNANAITCGHDGWTLMTFDTERWDTDTIHSVVANTSRLTCKTAGKYLVIGLISFDHHATGCRHVTVTLNGVVGAGTMMGEMNFNPDPVGGAHNTRMQISLFLDLAVNDYVQLSAFQNSGGNLDVTKEGSFTPEFMMSLITE